VYHDEEFPRENASEAHNNDDMEYNRMDEMLEDLRGDPDLVFPLNPEEPPPLEVKKFFDLLKAAEEPLHEHTTISILVFVTRLMAIKSKFVIRLMIGGPHLLILRLCMQVVENPMECVDSTYLTLFHRFKYNKFILNLS
jgi:hypothetical protein